MEYENHNQNPGKLRSSAICSISSPANNGSSTISVVLVAVGTVVAAAALVRVGGRRASRSENNLSGWFFPLQLENEISQFGGQVWMCCVDGCVSKDSLSSYSSPTLKWSLIGESWMSLRWLWFSSAVPKMKYSVKESSEPPNSPSLTKC